VDKVDTMIGQSVAMLDDLDKQLNVYVMRYVMSRSALAIADHT
jgi:RNA processing factor Prp31